MGSSIWDGSGDSKNDSRFDVYFENTLIGSGVNCFGDMPNVMGDFIPAPAFEKHRALFEQEYALLEAEQYEEHTKLLGEIFSRGLRIESRQFGNRLGALRKDVTPDGFVYLHIHDGKVWWRPA